MKVYRLFPLCLLFTAFCTAQQDAAGQKKAEPGGMDCVHQNLQAAHGNMEEANRRFAASDVPAAHNAVDAAVSNVHHAVDCSLQVRKSEKKAEIELRKLSRRIEAIAQTLDSEERPYLARAQKDVEDQRDRLLRGMFGDAAAGSGEKKP